MTRALVLTAAAAMAIAGCDSAGGDDAQTYGAKPADTGNTATPAGADAPNVVDRASSGADETPTGSAPAQGIEMTEAPRMQAAQ